MKIVIDYFQYLKMILRISYEDEVEVDCENKGNRKKYCSSLSGYYSLFFTILTGLNNLGTRATKGHICFFYIYNKNI